MHSSYAPRVVSCLVLLAVLALFAPAAHALEQTYLRDPGAVGGPANETFSFDETSSQLEVGDFLIFWTDGKTLEWQPGTYRFNLTAFASKGVGYSGFFLDAAGNEIPGTDFRGNTTSESDANATTIELFETTVFHGIRFDPVATPGGLTPWQWKWLDRPLVGQGSTEGDQPPIADAGEPVTAAVGAPVAFDGSASVDPDTPIVQYAWDFGDDGTGSGEQVNHTYAARGLYNVTLTVTDTLGLSDSATTTANIGEVGEPPTVDAGGPYTAKLGVPVNFSAASSGGAAGPIQYDWDFGDGTPPPRTQDRCRATPIRPVASLR